MIDGFRNSEKNQTVTNDSFTEFYKSPYGVFALEILYVLNQVKTTASAEMVPNSLPVVSLKELLDEAFKGLVFKFWLS